MLIWLKTFDGHNINDGTAYRAVLLNPRQMPAAKPVWIEQAEADATDAGTFGVDVSTRAVAIEVKNYAQRVALVQQLKAWFRRGTRGNLVATFTDDSVDYQLDCRVINLVQDENYPLRFLAVLQSAVTDWRSVSVETDSWTVTSTGGNKTITVGGDAETRLQATLTATVAPGSGYFYQKLVQFPNVPGVDFGVRPWCLTIDTAALVTASKMQADCDDLRIYAGDVELKRWIDSPNTTTTKVWFNLAMRAGASLKLKTAINNSETVTTMQFVVDTANKAAVKALPVEGIVYHGSEWFAYRGTDPVNARITIVARGVFGTTKQTHALNDVFLYIQHPLRMVYGNAAATNPATDDPDYDDEKPIFDLNASDNTKWVYTASTKFYDPDAPSRTGQWTPSLKRVAGSNVTELYNIKQDAESGDAAMGMTAGAWQLSTAWKADTIVLSWALYAPCGLSKITCTGQKYRNSALWLPGHGAQHSANGTNWTNLWTEATPGSLTTWTAWATHSAVSIANTSKWVRFVAQGGFAATANAYASSEALTATVEFYTTNLPTATFSSEIANYPLSLTLSNGANGDALTLLYPAQFNLPFVLDGENYTADFDEVNAHRAITLNDESRTDWIRLAAGSNTLTIAAVDVGTLGVVLSWYRRRV